MEVGKAPSAKLFVVTVAGEVNVQVTSFSPEEANERLMQQAVADLQR